MTQILLLTSSLRGDASFSTKVAKAVVEAVADANPGATTVVRDLGVNPPPHIDAHYVEGRLIGADTRTIEQTSAVERSDELVAELMAADVVVIASAMINFGLSSTLKSWFDNVLRPGGTFTYVDGAPKGLATGKTAYIVEARGGVYSEGPMKAFDFQEPYLRALLGFIGITDVRALPVERIAFGPEAIEASIASAIDRIPALLKGA